MSSTIEDISKRLGISVSTVSKALNAYPDVAEETRERVLAAARELDYTPSAAARNLRRGRSEKIGLLINNPISFLSEYISEVIAGAALQAEANGHNLILYTAAVQHPNELKRICRSREVDGLLVIFEPSPEAVDVLIAEKMPFVVFGRRIDNPTVSYIAPDNREGAYRLTRHLISLGHRRIGFTTRPELGTVSEDRFSGYRQALKDAGIHYDPSLVVETMVEANSGGRALNNLLALSDPPTAVFAFYDLLASDAMKAAQKLGLRVPEDIAIAGFDGLRSSSITTPPITTVAQPLEQMGQQAADMLVEQINNSDHVPVQRVLPVELVIRESTQGTED